MCGGVIEAPGWSARISRCNARIRGGIPLGHGGRGGGNCPIRPRESGPLLWMPCGIGRRRGVRGGFSRTCIQWVHKYLCTGYVNIPVGAGGKTGETKKLSKQHIY